MAPYPALANATLTSTGAVIVADAADAGPLTSAGSAREIVLWCLARNATLRAGGGAAP